MPVKKEIPIRLPDKLPVTDWLIYGLDPSLTRSGYALLLVSEDNDTGGSVAEWMAAGSLKNGSSKDPLWIRAKAIALHLRDILDKTSLELKRGFVQNNEPNRNLGLIISMEYPTQVRGSTNDFLQTLNRIIQLIFFEDSLVGNRFQTVRVLTTNPATLRSLMGLHTKGNNKGENIVKAREFADISRFPYVDSDACDGILLAMMGRWVASLLMGLPKELPDRVRDRLCSINEIVRGKGRNARVTTEGLLWTTDQRPEYWYSYSRKDYVLEVRDAASVKKGLERTSYSI